ncbi:MAG: peptidoglycan editing factor PgeF [Hyphomicrobiaceae bacterium]|nr:peptidoglycan editing factor PgeF [Hyphomicrobiaceae bacterium]
MLTPITSPNLSAIPNLAHGFFTRQGGVSGGIYGALNCGLGSQDLRVNVLENRARVARHLGTSGERLLTAYQIHSAEAVIVTEPWGPDAQPKADALVTKTPGLALGALAADCTPILFCDPEARVIAAAHAGWKGALCGVIAATVEAMESIGADRKRIIAAIGPCIGPQNYEVGPEFQLNFTTQSSANSAYFHTPAAASRPYFDLPAFVRDSACAAGISTVTSVTTCTYADPDRFFSYRRTTHAREPDYGRQISAIALA